MYYDKYPAFTLITNSDHEKDSMVQFKKSYTILEAIKDVGQAWEEIPSDFIHECFQKVFEFPGYLVARKEIETQ